jgi:glycosyltransferase involved in cell wall biosynthesis
MPKKPLVSINMVVYNGDKYIERAIQSILMQDLGDWELIIVDNGSVDNTRFIIEGFSSDERIRPFFLSLPDEIRSRNCALEHSQGEFIAILDSDDIAYANRLMVQVEYLNIHKDIDLAGSYTDVIDQDGNRLYTNKYPETSFQIKWRLFFGTPIAHSSIMFRNNIGIKYREGYQWSCDRELYVRLMGQIEFANIPEPLVQFRVHSGNQDNLEKTEIQKHNELRILRLINSQYLDLLLDTTIYETVIKCRRRSITTTYDLEVLSDYLTTVKINFRECFADTKFKKKILDKDASAIWLSWNILNEEGLLQRAKAYLSAPHLVDLRNGIGFTVNCLKH